MPANLAMQDQPRSLLEAAKNCRPILAGVCAPEKSRAILRYVDLPDHAVGALRGDNNPVREKLLRGSDHVLSVHARQIYRLSRSPPSTPKKKPPRRETERLPATSSPCLLHGANGQLFHFAAIPASTPAVSPPKNIRPRLGQG